MKQISYFFISSELFPFFCGIFQFCSRANPVCPLLVIIRGLTFQAVLWVCPEGFAILLEHRLPLIASALFPCIPALGRWGGPMGEPYYCCFWICRRLCDPATFCSRLGFLFLYIRLGLVGTILHFYLYLILSFSASHCFVWDRSQFYIRDLPYFQLAAMCHHIYFSISGIYCLALSPITLTWETLRYYDALALCVL